MRTPALASRLLILAGLLLLTACGEILPALGLDRPGSTASIAASTTLVQEGESVTVAWDVVDADRALLVVNGAETQSYPVGLAGIRSFTLQQDTAFVISALGTDDEVLAAGTVIVTVEGDDAEPGVFGELLGVTRDLVPPGAEVEIRWLASTVKGASSATLTISDADGTVLSETVGLHGSRMYAPSSDSDLTLTVQDAAGKSLATSTSRIRLSAPFEVVQLDVVHDLEYGWFEQVVTFDAGGSSNLDLVDYLVWEFGDGTTVTQRRGDADFLRPSHSYGFTSSVGRFQVVATAHNDFGDSVDFSLDLELESRSATAVAAGGFFSMMLLGDGTVWTWGQNESGQLGLGDLNDRNYAVQVGAGTGMRAVVAIAAGENHALALDAQGRLWAWGANSYGELGTGSSSDNEFRPVRVQQPAGLVVQSIFAGQYNSGFITAEGSLWMWGRGLFGVLGNGRTDDRAQPVLVSTDTGLTAVSSVHIGSFHVVAVSQGGEVWGWGRHQANPEAWFAAYNTPQLLSASWDLQGYPIVTAGHSFSIILDGSGRIWSWGSSYNGVLGIGHIEGEFHAPQLVDFGSDPFPRFVLVSAGGSFTVAMTAVGVLYSWGSNSCGQLGDMTSITRWAPVLIVSAEDEPYPRFVYIASGNVHTIALAEDGTVWVWGWNRYGQIGNGSWYVIGHPIMLRAPPAGYL